MKGKIMKKPLAFIALGALLLSCINAEAAAPTRSNYVIFSILGDCHQEDCIALLKDSLQSLRYSIVSIDVASLAPHQTSEYKTVTITFTDIKTAPYGQVMQKIADLGYRVISYVIHDTRGGKDVIVPH